MNPSEAHATVAGREVAWEGFFNARDLGGLPTRSGRVTRPGALIRSADVRFATADGWRSAYDAGVRTIVDLRNDHEVREDVPAAPDPAAVDGPARRGIERVGVPLDDVDDTDLWRYLYEQRIDGTPLYYRPFLDRKAERCATAVAAVARARPGGVIFHCVVGRDRTGLLALLLLALVDVDPEIIAADYALTTQALRPMFALLGRDDEAPAITRLLDARRTTARDAILATLDGLDVEGRLLAAGLEREDLARLRSRLLA
jgi:hypothetical protein